MKNIHQVMLQIEKAFQELLETSDTPLDQEEAHQVRLAFYCGAFAAVENIKALEPKFV